MSWEVYANFNQDLATNWTINEDWEAVLPGKKAKTKSSADNKTDTNEEENEMFIVSAGTAISYLDDLGRNPPYSFSSPCCAEAVGIAHKPLGSL